MKAGTTHDIILKDVSGTETGLLLAEGEDRARMWQVSEVPMFPTRYSMGSPEYAQMAPESELVWAQDDWRGGFGEYKYTRGSNRYNESHDCDCRWPNQIILGPKLVGSADSGGSAVGWADYENSICVHEEYPYIIVGDGTDAIVWKWNESAVTPYWIKENTITTATPGAVVSFSEWLVASYDDSGTKKYKYLAAISLKDSLTTGDDASRSADSDDWEAQTFTTTSAYTITAVQLKLARLGGDNPGTVTVSIRATTSDLPSGSDLTSGTTDGDTLTAGTTGEWREIPLTPYALSDATKYAICIRNGSSPHVVIWRVDSDAGYATGARCYSDDTGSSWTEDTSDDYMFKTYGMTAYAEVSKDVLKGLAVVKNQLWGVDSDNKVLSCTDPTSAGNWSTATTIAYDWDTQGLISIEDVLFVPREDGLYSFDAEETVSNLTPSYVPQSHPTNFAHMVTTHNVGYFTAQWNQVLRYEAGSIANISPLLYGPNSDLGLAKCHGISAGLQWVYLLVSTDEAERAETTSHNILVFAGRERVIGDDVDFVWHPIVDFDCKYPADLKLCGVGYGKKSADEYIPRLWFGAYDATTRGKIGTIKLPRGHTSPTEDSDYEFATTGYVYTGWYDADFVDIDKAFRYLTIDCDNVTSARYVTVSYEVDDGGTWYELGTATIEGKTTMKWDKLSEALPKQGRKIRFKIAPTTDDEDETPVFKSFALHSVLRPEPRKRYQVGVKCADNLPMLNGTPDSQKAKTIADNLNKYRKEVEPLTLTDVDGNEHKVQMVEPLTETYIAKETGRSRERVFSFSLEELL